MNSILLILFVSLLSASVILQSAAKVEEANGNVKTLSYPNSASEIVKDLIANWNSPLVYLKKRGYLMAPQIGLESLLGRKQTDEVKASKDGEKAERVVRSFEEEGKNDLGHLFRTFFSSSDNSVSDKIKTKMGVPWDMNALKNSVRNEAYKYYEKFYDNHNQKASHSQPDEGQSDIEKQVAQLYPSVVFTPNKEHAAEELKKETVEHMEPKFLNGIAKLLTSRSKPLPLQLQEQKKQLDAANPAI